MDILKNIDELLISWGTAPSLADMLDQFIALCLCLSLRFWLMSFVGISC